MQTCSPRQSSPHDVLQSLLPAARTASEKSGVLKVAHDSGLCDEGAQTYSVSLQHAELLKAFDGVSQRYPVHAPYLAQLRALRREPVPWPQPLVDDKDWMSLGNLVSLNSSGFQSIRSIALQRLPDYAHIIAVGPQTLCADMVRCVTDNTEACGAAV